jgi:hypothetical protein
MPTDTAGMVTIRPAKVPFVVAVSKINYLDQVIKVFALAGKRQWDDAGTIFRTDSSQAEPPGRIVMEVRLGRLSFSPSASMDPEAEKLFHVPDQVLNKFPRDQSGRRVNFQWSVKLQHTFTRTKGNQVIYNFPTIDNPNYWNINFWYASGRQMLGDRSGKGWAAFQETKSRVVKPQNEGHFMMVEWTSPPTPDLPKDKASQTQDTAPHGFNRYLVGLWRPRSSIVPGSTVNGTVVARDVVVFFPPTTGPATSWLNDRSPFRGMYPYSLNQYKDDNVPDWLLGQRYVEVLPSYLFRDRYISQAILAAERDALVIIPIQPAGKWGILSTAAGLSRLVQEAILFEHRQHPLPDIPGGSIDTAPERNDRGGIIERLHVATHVPPPPLGHVVVAGFSAGVGAIRTLLLSAKLPPSPHTWSTESNDPYGGESNDPYGGDARTFLAAWREIWDFDGSMAVLDPGYYPDKPWTGDYLGPFATLLREWQERSGSNQAADSSDPKIVRVYHTTLTTPAARGGLTKMAVFDRILGHSGIVRGKPNAKASERVGDGGNWIWFGSGYLENNRPDSWPEGASNGSLGRPEFWNKSDPHQAVIEVCHGHAVANSRLRKLVR